MRDLCQVGSDADLFRFNFSNEDILCRPAGKRIGVIAATEYTQSGNGHFLAYIPSWWKISPAWWGVEGARPPLSLYLPSRTKLWCTLQLKADTFPLCLLYPYMYSVIAAFAMHAPPLFMKRRETIKRNQIQIRFRLDGFGNEMVTVVLTCL